MKKDLTPSQKALKLLSQVPSKEFIIGRFTDEVGKCCAIGHLQRLTSANPNDYKTSNCFDKADSYSLKVRVLCQHYLEEKHKTEYKDLSSINNGEKVNGYTQKTPKARVIAVLKDMVKEGL